MKAGIKLQKRIAQRKRICVSSLDGMRVNSKPCQSEALKGPDSNFVSP